MRLTVLGCSGSVAAPGVPASGYLVEHGDTSIVLDLGNGAFAELLRHVDPLTLDAVALSHLHPDHVADVSSLQVHLKYHPSRFRATRAGEPLPRLPVYGPTETASRLAAQYAPSAAELAATDVSDVLDVRPYPSCAPAVVGSITLRAAEVLHLCESYATRLDADGRSLVYTGDTAWCDELVAIATGADVLLCEATWVDDPRLPPGVHLSGREAGELAAAAGVGTLVLTHLAPWTDRAAVLAEARAAFDGVIEVATPGAVHAI